MEHSDKKKKGIFYGWIVCATGLLLIFVTMGTVNGFTVFMPFIIKEHGLTNAQTSSLVTLRCVVSFVSMLLIGKYYEKLGYRIGTVIAVLCACVTFFIYSVATDYKTFCIGAAISGISYGLGSMIPISVIMNRWFVSHRALSIGICGTGSGVATVVLPPICTKLIETYSMAQTFRILAFLVLAIAVVIFVFMRDRPEDKGLRALGAEDAKQPEAVTGTDETNETDKADVGEKAGIEKSPEDGETANEKTGKRSKSKKTAKQSRSSIICIAFVCIFMGALANPGFVHLSVLFTSEGFKSMTVAAALSITGVLLIVSKILCGHVTDRLGGRRSSMLFGAILLIGHIMCCFAFLQSVPLCMATVVILGLGYPLATIGPSIWALDMSAAGEYPKTVRRFQILYSGGALIFASVPGIMADFFGNYISAYILFTALMAAALVLIVAAYKAYNMKRRKNSAG